MLFVCSVFEDGKIQWELFSNVEPEKGPPGKFSFFRQQKNLIH
jgi:hypothetical protein